APRIRAEEQSALACEASRETAGREQDRPLDVLPQRRLELDRARRLGEEPCESARVVAPTGRERVLGVAPDRLRPERLEPAETVVEPFPDQPLQPLVAARAFRAKALPLKMPPDDAGGQEHRAARPRPLLEHARLEPELAEAHGRNEARHPRAGNGDAQLS